MNENQISVGKGKYKIDLTAITTADGFIITIVGGEKPHVGAVAISIPRPSLKNSSKISTTTSVFTLIGHKDDVLAKPAAEKLAKKLKQTVVVVAGVHIDEASEEEIKELTTNSMQGIRLFLKKAKK
jgi:predicted esterase